MVTMWRSCGWLALLVGAAGAASLAADPPLVVSSTTPPPGDAVMPRMAGFHNLYYTGQLAGEPRRMAYSLFLPAGYDTKGKWPMLVYLIGVGDRGDNHAGLYNNGPPPYLKADKLLRDWVPFIVFTPQCPADLRWDSPGMTEYLVEMIRWATRSLPTDPDRVYLTGLSMGGAATWRVALGMGGTFAVVAPFCAPGVEPDRMAAAVKGETVCIICGGADNQYTAGSRKMYGVLRDAGVDVLYVEVPGQGHGVWPAFYASRQFYEFLLMHRRGQKPPLHRPTTEQLVAISYTPPNSADADLAKPLQKFLPWWFLSNCGRDNSPGLKEQMLGRKNVFVTTPLARDVPCRLMYTVAVAKQKKTTLRLTVGAAPEGQWELLVLAESRELLKRTIGGVTAAAGSPPAPPWVDVSVDLAGFAGQQVHLELQNRQGGSAHCEAYWADVRIVEE